MVNSILLENLDAESLKELIQDGIKSELQDFKKEI